MRLLRVAILPALVLLLALPSAADVRSTPAIEGPPPSAIEGTITSLHVPIAGGGPIVSLLSGLVSFDATGATVRIANGTEGTTGDLQPGQRIVAFVDPAAAPLKATAILIMMQREDVSLTGRVEDTDLSASTITVLGFTVLVTEKTVFGGPWDGVGKPGLGDVKVGDLVLVAATADAGDLVALRVMKLSPSPTPTVRLHGVVGAIGTDSWTLVLPDGTETILKVDAGTKIVGNPAVGDEVDVLARRQADGTLLAVVILKPVEPPAVPTERYQGVVKAIGEASWTIGPKTGDGPDRVFAVNERTKILGDPVVGDEVGVLAQKQPDGSWLALVIARAIVAPPVAEVTFEGVVKRISGAMWQVGDTQVAVSRATELRGAPGVGDTVRVTGVRIREAVVQARLVEKL